MEHEAEDGRCNNWTHVWMQGCQTCVENRARQQALWDAVEAIKQTPFIRQFEVRLAIAAINSLNIEQDSGLETK